MSADERAIQRQAYAGLIWSKQVSVTADAAANITGVIHACRGLQFYHYGVDMWLGE